MVTSRLRRLIRSTRRRGSRHPPRTPAAGAELAAVDDAVVLVAGGAEHGRSAHLSAADFTVEEIADRAAFVVRGEGELDLVAIQPSADRALEMGRALMAGEL